MNDRTAGVVALETVTQGGIKFRALDETNPGSLRTVPDGLLGRSRRVIVSSLSPGATSAVLVHPG